MTTIGPRKVARSTSGPPPRQGSVTAGSPPSTGSRRPRLAVVHTGGLLGLDQLGRVDVDRRRARVSARRRGRTPRPQPSTATRATAAAANALARRVMPGPRCAPAWRRRPGRSAPRRTTGTSARPGRRRRRACGRGRPRRPCQIRWWLSIVQSRLGNSAPTACSTLTGSVSSVQPKRRASRPKWVSTVMPGMPKALPSTTLAVLRPTPGSVTRSSRRGGTSPSYRSTSAGAQLEQRLGLGAEEPERPDDLLELVAVGGRHRRARRGRPRTASGRTALTRLSVVWALSTVTTSSSKGLSKSSSQRASG